MSIKNPSAPLPQLLTAVASHPSILLPVEAQQITMITCIQRILREIVKDSGPNPMKTLREFIATEKELTTEHNQHLEKKKTDLAFQTRKKENISSQKI